MKKLWLSFLSACLFCSISVHAEDGNRELVTFLSGFETLKADFEQGTFDQNGRQLQNMRGSLVIQRPGRFRWDYQYPYEQQIIADGTRVWFYDIDLEQVTVKPQEQTLGSTPIELLSKGKALTENFDVQFAYARNGLSWYSLEPKQSDATFERLSLGMVGGVLSRMELLDSFGQLTELYFENMQVDAQIDPAVFDFEIPQDVDVLDETL